MKVDLTKEQLKNDFAFANLDQLAARIKVDAEAHWNDRTFDHEAWQQFISNQFMANVVPQTWGENGDWAEGLVLLERMARKSGEAGFCIAIAAQLWTLRALYTFGTDAQKAKWIPRLLAGELAATAIAEPDSGSDLAGSKTRLSKTEGGTYLLNGAKSHISLAHEASLILVPVLEDTDSGSQLRLVLLDKSKKGISRGKNWEKMGFRTLPTEDIIFENVEISPEDIIEKGKNLANIMAYARILYGMISASLASRLVEKMTIWANERKQGGKPIGERQFIQERITSSALGAEQARLMALEAMRALSARENEYLMKASMAKLAGAKSFRLAAENCVASMGSLGYEEGAVSRALRDSFGFLSSGGTEEFHKKQIYQHLKRSF